MRIIKGYNINYFIFKDILNVTNIAFKAKYYYMQKKLFKKKEAAKKAKRKKQLKQAKITISCKFLQNKAKN
jgi:hypothetical protein